MTKTEKMLRSILGDTNRNLGVLVCAIHRTEYLLFQQKIPMDEIRVTNVVYPVVATKLKKEIRPCCKTGGRLFQHNPILGRPASDWRVEPLPHQT